MSDPARPIEAYRSVVTWKTSYRRYWGEALRSSMLEALSRFCEGLGADPDQIIDECLPPAGSGEGVLLRTKARRKYIEVVDRFEERTERRTANAVRSFLIHNGVAMSPGVLAAGRGG